MEYSIPAIRRPQLGRVLRALRKTAGLTLDQVGPDLDMSAGTLKAGSHPVLSVDAVIDETALQRPVGGPLVQKGQLRHLLALTDLPNLSVRVLPRALGMSPGQRGAFSVLSFPPDTIDDLAYIEHAGGNLQISKKSQVIDLRRRFDTIARLSMTESESATLISRLAGG